MQFMRNPFFPFLHYRDSMYERKFAYTFFSYAHIPVASLSTALPITKRWISLVPS